MTSAGTRAASFPPALGPRTRLLILGSLPGQVSLARRQYYAHPQNQFWRLLGAVLGVDLAGLPYDARLAALAGAGIGLWDVVGSAVRLGSLDSAIRDPAPNDLAGLVAALPGLAAIAFNGAAALKIGARQLGNTAIPLVALPSSSPAYAAMTFAEKRNAWLTLRRFLPAFSALPPH